MCSCNFQEPTAVAGITISVVSIVLVPFALQLITIAYIQYNNTVTVIMQQSLMCYIHDRAWDTDLLDRSDMMNDSLVWFLVHLYLIFSSLHTHSSFQHLWVRSHVAP